MCNEFTEIVNECTLNRVIISLLNFVLRFFVLLYKGAIRIRIFFNPKAVLLICVYFYTEYFIGTKQNMFTAINIITMLGK